MFYIWKQIKYINYVDALCIFNKNNSKIIVYFLDHIIKNWKVIPGLYMSNFRNKTQQIFYWHN